MNGAGSATSTQFLIVGPPSRLIGMDVFLDVIMRCVSDTVAAKAIAFITALPSRLSPQLTRSSPGPDAVAHTHSSGVEESQLSGDNELTTLRTLLLEQCTSQLSLTQGLGLGKDRPGPGAGPGSGADEGDDDVLIAVGSRDRVLKRLLKLLNSLLEESLGDLGALRPHGGLARGRDVNISVTGANKFKGMIDRPPRHTLLMRMMLMTLPTYVPTSPALKNSNTNHPLITPSNTAS